MPDGLTEGQARPLIRSRAFGVGGQVWLVWLAFACNTIQLTPSGGSGSIDVSPGHLTLPPIGGDVCPAIGCCGAAADITPGPDGQIPADACCGQFGLHVEGRDDLTGMRWSPGSSSRLLVYDDRVGTYAISPDGSEIPVCYRLAGEKPPSCAEDPSSPICETGLPPDDGLLELLFKESPSVDVWLEIERPERINSIDEVAP